MALCEGVQPMERDKTNVSCQSPQAGA